MGRKISTLQIFRGISRIYVSVKKFLPSHNIV